MCGAVATCCQDTRPQSSYQQQAYAVARMVCASAQICHATPGQRTLITGHAACRLFFSRAPCGAIEWNSTASPLRGLTARCLRAHSLKPTFSPPGAGMLGKTCAQRQRCGLKVVRVLFCQMLACTLTEAFRSPLQAQGCWGRPAYSCNFVGLNGGGVGFSACTAGSAP